MGTRAEILGRLELGLKRYNHGVRVDDEIDDNKLIISIVDDWECVESPQHKMMNSDIFRD